MNRLQKKCLIATAGGHLLLVVILLVGPGFFTSTPKPDDTPLLTVIPANLIDAAFTSGVKNAQPPPPTPIVRPPEPPPEPQPQPQPPPPKPVVHPPEPRPEPVKPEPEPVKPSPDVLTPAPKPPKPKPHEVKPDLTMVKRAVTPKNTVNPAAENAAKERQRLADARRAAALSALKNIKANSSSSTDIEMPGESSVSYANYASAVKSIYEQAWIPPVDTASDDAMVKVTVTIARDGTVITSRILNLSGDAEVDRSVQRTLNRVTFVAPFPDGAKEKERTFIINFNLKAKRMLG